MIPRTIRFTTLVAAFAMGLATGSYAAAAANDAVVIRDQQHQSTPCGSYHRRRQTRVFGSASGYRYGQYSERLPGRIVYPHGGRHRGYARPGYRHGRGAYGFAGTHVAPAAPRGPGYIGGHAYGRGDRFGRSARPYAGRRAPDTRRNASRRAIEPAQRALPRAQRAIRP